MPVLFAPRALTPDGWARDVLIEVAADGSIVAVRADAEPGGAERLAGPVLPGLANLHSHAFQRAMAGLAERAAGARGDFWSWREVMYRFLDRLGPGEVEAIAAQLYVEMLKAGYTAVAEFHYLHHGADGTPYDDPAEMAERIVAASRRAGIALTLLPVLYQSGGFGGIAPGPAQRRFVCGDERFARLLQTLAARHGGARGFRLGMAPHSLRAAGTAAVLRALVALDALDAAAPVHIHVAEQVKEVDDCLAWSGRRPVDLLLDELPVDERWCVVHATHIDDGEVRRLAGSGAVAGLCPTTEANLGDGLFPLAAFLAAGGRLGVGSDSHVSVSAAEELRWLEYGQRLAQRRRAVAALGDGSTGARLFRLALAGGAQALGRAAGAIAPGRRGDLVVLDGEHPALAGRDGEDVVDSWIFAHAGNPVRDVMVGGRWRVRDGHHRDEAAVAAAYRAAVARLA